MVDGRGRLTVGNHLTQIVNTEERVLNIQGLHPPHRDRMRRNRGFAGLDTTGESWVDMNSVGAMGSMGRGGRGRNLNGRRTGGWPGTHFTRLA